MSKFNGTNDLNQAAASLASRLPDPLKPLARIAYNYRWSWTPDGDEIFQALHPQHWKAMQCNPIRHLLELSTERLNQAAQNTELVTRIQALDTTIAEEMATPGSNDVATPEKPVAFLCAEFGIHQSLPIYSGGLGVLAGDILKECSDMALPVVGVGILYRQGYFHQRIDSAGQQHEFWIPVDPERKPAALVHGENGQPLTITVPIRDHEIVVQIWRVNIGRTPLYLLDAERPENSPLDRWITGRLYVGDNKVRLAQYALMGVGAIKALHAMGLEPSVIHLNEGHAALSTLELARTKTHDQQDLDTALAYAKEKTVFTTHTPVAAGNETYGNAEVADVLGQIPSLLNIDIERFLQQGRIIPDNHNEPFGMTPLGLRMSRSANGVSKRHGEVAREMWRPLFGNIEAAQVPITHVTNGVHVPTWTVKPMRDLLANYLGLNWQNHASSPKTWEAVENIPDAELWQVRCQMRRTFIEYLREKTVNERLGRYESEEYIEAALNGLSADTLTLGFARRVATYKRLHLLTHDVDRARGIIDDPNPVQLVLAGKAHPQDNEGKAIVRNLFNFKGDGHIAERISYLDNYDIGIAKMLVSGCDVWVNVPRAPMEASGTSGMKSALNGGLNLSVLDGWWSEAFDGSNGWAISSDSVADPALQDTRDADTLYSLLEQEVIPMFYDRDENGVPREWVQRIKASLRTNGPHFSARRMMEDYERNVYSTNVISHSVPSTISSTPTI